ncbi:MAG: DUF6364 family protein [Candidatus Dormibacter sp.]
MTKDRLLVEVEKDLRDFAKGYAASHGLSLSQLVEQLFSDLREATARNEGRSL